MDLGDAVIGFTMRFLSIFIEAAPFLLAGTLTSGLIEVFVRRDDVMRFMPRSPLLASLIGGGMGFLFPVGECGVVPVTRRLIHKGMPISAGISFLLAAPIINPVAIAVTYAAFHNSAMTIVYWRTGIALIVAVSTGLLFAFHSHPEQLFRRLAPVPEESAARLDLLLGLKHALRLAAREFLEWGRYLIIGSLLAAGVRLIITQDDLEGLATNPVNSVFVMQARAFILSIGSITDAFAASDFVDTFALGSVLAFLTFGPMVDIKNILLLLGVFRRRVVFYLILLPFLMIALITIWANLNSRF